MRELGILLASWLVCVNAQIIFPDQFAVLRDAEANQPPVKSPFPSLPNNAFDGNSNAGSFVSTSNIQHNSGLPGLGAPSASAGAPPSVPSFPTGNAYDNEALYWSNHVNNLIARGVTKFTLDMHHAIHRTRKTSAVSEKENIIFSPLSLVGTLAMVLLGSAGITFDEVARILGLESGVDISSHSEIVHQMFGLLLDSIDAKVDTEGPQVTMASGVFVQSGYPIRPEFKAISQHVYKNEVINLDFIGHSNEARQTVNDWVKARTNGKIKSILTQPLDPDTKLILASALYFSGEWNRHFIRGATKRKPFMVTPTKSITVDMMYSGGDFPFYEDKQLGVKIVALPYKGYDLASSSPPNFKYQASMYVLLPTSKNENALNNLENRLTPEVLDIMIGNMVNQSCILGLPRMKLTSTLNLNDALNSLGLSSLFDSRRANLGLLTSGYDASSTGGDPNIFSRIGEGDDNNPTGGTTGNRSSFDPSTKNNYFRYEDKKGGYSVKQWNSGVIIEKIHRRRRSLEALAKQRTREQQPDKGKRAGTTQREEAETYQLPLHNSTDRVKIVAIGEEKYKFEPKAARSRRQSRPIDEDFVRFIQSRETYTKFGLDVLRNSHSIGNPGLFASDVLHKVEMDVTETGTVGAAATTILLQRGGDIKRLIAERPFLFFIRHEPSRLILFWGTVNKPMPNY